MASLNAFLVAVEMAERQRDAARQALQDLQRARSASEAQLQQLQGYAHETEGRWGMRADATVKPEVMYHHYQFMDRLGHAMGVQSSVIGEQEGRVRAASQALLQAELRVAALRKVVERRRHDLAQAEARRGAETDGRARRAAFRKGPGHGAGPWRARGAIIMTNDIQNRTARAPSSAHATHESRGARGAGKAGNATAADAGTDAAGGQGRFFAAAGIARGRAGRYRCRCAAGRGQWPGRRPGR